MIKTWFKLSFYTLQVDQTYWEAVGGEGGKTVRKGVENSKRNDGHRPRIWWKGEEPTL